MNTKLTIKNFRVFDENGVIVDLKPITVLTGCNSSGKSSVVKAALMLNEFWKQQKGDEFKLGNGTKIDFSTYPNNLLGKFDKVLHKASESKILTFEYELYSKLLSEYVTIKLEFEKSEKDQLGSAYLSNVEIKNENGVILSSSVLKNLFNQDLRIYEIDCNLIKEQFLDFLILGSVCNRIDRLYDMHTGFAMDCKKISDEEYNNEIEILKEFKQKCQSDKPNRLHDVNSVVLNLRFKKLNIFDSENYKDLILIAEKAHKTGSLFYIPIMDIIGKMDKVELKSFVDEHSFDDNKSKEVIGEFMNSHCDTFAAFFENIEREELSKLPFQRYGGFYSTSIYQVVMNWNEIICPDKKISEYYSKREVEDPFTKEYLHQLEENLWRFNIALVKECLLPTHCNLSYVSSSRATIKRLYTLENKDDFSMLLKQCLETGNIKPKNSFINKWVKKFGIGDSITFHADSEGLGVQIRLHKTPEDQKGRLLADEGYGITQLLSIMLQIEMIDSDSDATIAVEEPEIHLHPKYQSLLADMFVDAYKERKIHFIIETHSEYLIRRLQLLVAGIETEQKLDKNDVSISYIYTKDEAEKENQPIVKNIAICEDGYLDDTFGSGFFDEATNLSRKLM